ncbi:MAG: hypothetical protein F6J89_06340 [Symploca sp. SIO1C4]|uniref:Uncharacterized protein n=1 Tax=Symploca sp. SIO1C4 TaxID=2607765 RepID=A0A6B3N9I1_9CYAN|nr:hypothetical protein [Symploca sp. SIO1C4]
MTNTDLTKYAKRIQSRLSSRGVKYSLQQCREALIKQLGDNLPTPEDISLVIENIQTSVTPPKTDKLATVTNHHIEPVDIPDNLEESTNLELPDQPEESLEHTLATTNSKLATNEQNGLVPQQQISTMVSKLFNDQPAEIQQQITQYSMERTFTNIREVQSFLENLRDMEFNLMLQTLQDHFNRRGSMLNVLNEVLQQQQAKDEKNRTSFFDSFQNQLTQFQQEMNQKLNQTSV